MTTDRRHGLALVLASAVGFGAMPIFAKLAYDDGVDVPTLLGLRFAIATALLWAIVVSTGRALPPRRTVLIALAMGGIGYAAESGAFFLALERIDASLASLLLYAYPAVVVAGAIALRREEPSARRFGACTLGVLGAALVVGGAGTGALDPVGVGLALGAAFAYAAYILAVDGLGDRVDPLVLAALVTTGATVPFTVAVLVTGPALPASATGWAMLATMAVVSTVVAITAFSAALPKIGASTASVAATSEPLVTVTLAALVLGERLAPIQALGGAVSRAAMALPLSPPILPWLARGRPALPDDDSGWLFERKYDGFRCIAYVDGDEVYLQSRGSKPLRKYFPELVFPEGRYVVDGEIVVRGEDGEEDFELLGNRIHPAESRINMLAEKTPASYVAFDLLAIDNEVLMDAPFSERRARLEGFVSDPIELAPAVSTNADAASWLQDTEGVVAKELESPYRPGKRDGMIKVKRARTLDAVIVGWRPGKEANTVGSLILGLYDTDGKLRVIGHTSGFKAKEKRELVQTLAPYESGDRGSADPSRWASERDLEWVGLRPELVVEVGYDQVSNGRIRHGTKLLRWRDDKQPAECLLDQLEQ